VSLHILSQPVPLIADETGVIRVGGTRVTLETIVGAFRRGESAEEIALQYPVVPLADVYDVIGYYLHHQDEVDEYLHIVEVEADRLRARIEQRFSPNGIRERLLARLSRQDSAEDVAPGD